MGKLEEDRDYYLSRYHYVADQRTKTMGFYFLAAVATLSATAKHFSDHPPMGIFPISFFVGVIHIVIPYWFMALDARNQMILKVIREKLIAAEKDCGTELFELDSNTTLTYNTVFLQITGLHLAFGLFLVILVFVKKSF